MLNSNKLKLILACVSLLICITTVQTSYAKYVTAATADTTMNIARWNISLNNTDIHTGVPFEGTITPTFSGSTYIAPGTIAPTAEGYFDLVIDSRNTDLSFDYQISITPSADSSVSDLIATSYQLNTDPVVNFTGNPVINGVVMYQVNSNINTIRVFIKWNDETGSMTNDADTDAAYNTDAPKMDVTLNFIQKVS